MSLLSCLLEAAGSLRKVWREGSDLSKAHLSHSARCQEHHLASTHCRVGGDLPHSTHSFYSTSSLKFCRISSKSTVPPWCCGKSLWHCFHIFISFTPEQSREQRALPANLAHAWHGKHKDFNSVGIFFSKWCYGLHIVLQDMYLNICNYFCCTPPICCPSENLHLQGTGIPWILLHEWQSFSVGMRQGWGCTQGRRELFQMVFYQPLPTYILVYTLQVFSCSSSSFKLCCLYFLACPHCLHCLCPVFASKVFPFSWQIHHPESLGTSAKQGLETRLRSISPKSACVEVGFKSQYSKQLLVWSSSMVTLCHALLIWTLISMRV